MGIFGGSSAPKPNLNVLGYGGTIMSAPDADNVIRPNPESLTTLIQTIPEKRFKQFAQVNADAREPFIDSSDATARTLMSVVEDIRKELREGLSDRLVVLYGSDSMTYLMAALGYGISKKELNGKSVVVTCAMSHLQNANTDAIANFNNAVYISLSKEIKGKVGLLFGRRFFPSIGLEKRQISKEFAFHSRFRRMAKLERSSWHFDRDPHSFDSVMGNPDQPLQLESSIQPYTVTPMTDYSLIGEQIKKNKATILVGLGDGNLRSDDESVGYLRRAAVEADGPVVVVGGAIYNAEEGIEIPRRRKKGEVYQGNGGLIPELISAGVMTQSEATVFIAMKIAEAQKSGKYTKAEIEDFIRFEIMNYPYVDLQSSRVKQNKK